MIQERKVRLVLLILSVVFLIVFSLSPVLWMMLISFSLRPDFLVTGAFSFTFKNYSDVLQSASLHFGSYFMNSVIIASVTACIVSAMTCFAAYAVSRMEFRGRLMIPIVILAVSMFPQISIVGYLYKIFSNLGWLNTYAALIMPYIALTVPLALWINMSYFSQLPRELDKAALVDGASRAAIVLKIIIPLSLPGIFSSFLLVFIQCFNEFLFALLLTIDYHAQTLPVGIAFFEGVHGEIPWGNLMAASTLGSLPLVLVTVICQRYIVSGLAGGAVKG